MKNFHVFLQVFTYDPYDDSYQAVPIDPSHIYIPAGPGQNQRPCLRSPRLWRPLNQTTTVTTVECVL